MTSNFSAIAIIPARLASTRLPRKVLREIAGQPMIARVYEAAKKSPLLRDVIIATDSEEVMQFAQARGWKAQMTSAEHRSGTDRVYEVAQRIAADVYVNIQGDEPLARPEHLDALLQPMQDAKVMVSTIKTPCPPQDVDNPNAVKVVTDLNGRALYFSRSTIPFDRDKTGGIRYFKHLGFYAYRRAGLDRFCNLPESKLEAAERLEQLRFLDNGIDIYVAETPFNTVGVDTEDDLRRVEEMVRTGNMHDTGGPLTASDLVQIVSGDVTHIRAIEMHQDAEVVKVAEEMPSTSLILMPNAVKRVLMGLLEGEILPEQAQTWASFVRRGYKSGGHGSVRSISIPYDASHEDGIADAVSRLDELGDLIDGSLDKDEIRLLLKKLDN